MVAASRQGFPTRSRSAERTVLGLGVGAALALVAVALLAFEDPRATAQAALERLASTTTDGVRAEWSALVRSEQPAPPISPRLRGSPARARGPAGSGASGARALESDAEPGSALFEALFSAAEVSELRGDLVDARRLLGQALESEPLSVAQRLRGQLRALQLSAAAGDKPAVLEQWSELLAQRVDGNRYLAGGWTLAGLPVLGLVHLAAGESLVPENSAAVEQHYRSAWEYGQLAFGLEPDRLQFEHGRVVRVHNALYEAYAERLEGLEPVRRELRVADTTTREQLEDERGFEALWLLLERGWQADPGTLAAGFTGFAGTAHLRAAVAERWSFAATPWGWLAVRRLGADEGEHSGRRRFGEDLEPRDPGPRIRVQACFLSSAGLQQALDERCQRAGVLPDDFELRLARSAHETRCSHR